MALKVTTFKERFASLFDESDKTTIELAKELHVSNQTISAWKTGVRSPRDSTVYSIANFFGVNVEWLMGFAVDKYNPDKETESWQDDPEIHIVSAMMETMTREQKQQVIDLIKILVKNDKKG